jgi:hypothetical protein
LVHEFLEVVLEGDEVYTKVQKNLGFPYDDFTLCPYGLPTPTL